MYLTSDGRQIVSVNRPADSILIIDDEFALLEMLQTVVPTFGYEVTVAADVDEAEGILTRQGTQAFQCVLTDYKMPRRTGLDLLRWLRHFDPNLSIVVNTGYASHEDVSSMIREGAVDVLRKPVQMDLLRKALVYGVRQTRIARRRASTEKAVLQVGMVQSYMLRIMGIRDLPWVHFYTRPVHQAGGDFVSSYPRQDGGNLLIMADVAGHNLDAAYISAFFHGAVHGMSRSDMGAKPMMAEINSFLLNKWNARDLSDSLEMAPEASVCALFVDVDRDRSAFTCYNNGLPPPVLTHSDGTSELVGQGNSPLGLYEDTETCVNHVEDAKGTMLLCFSDGLSDFAHLRRINVMSLAYRIHCLPADERETLLSEADDDIMLLRLCMEGGDASSFYPVIIESYPGDAYKDIDSVEDAWARSLLFAIPDIPEDRLYAILLTSRETILNAMRHGCGGSEEKRVDFHVHYSESSRTVLIMIRDPGPGYSDNFLTEEAPDMEKERHSGLILIRNFPDKVWTERNNSVVHASFALN